MKWLEEEMHHQLDLSFSGSVEKGLSLNVHGEVSSE